MPPSVATSVRSRAVPPPCSSQANPPATSANAASSVARPPSAGSSAAQTTPAIPSATNATRATLDRNGHLRGRAEADPPVRGQQRVVRRDEDAAALARPARAARRRAPPCGRGRSRASARRARADRARRRRRPRCRGARAPRSRGRADGGTAANASPNCVERRRRALLVTADAERDLVERGLAHEVAAGILREVRRAAGPRRRAPRSGSSSPAAIFASVVLPLPFAPFEGDDLAAADAERDAAEHLGPVAVRVVGRRRAGRPARRACCAEADRAGRARPRSAGATPRATRAPPPTGASRTMRPSSIITTRSAIASARSTRCSERTTAHCACSTAARNASAPSASSWDVGSSSSRSCGRSASAEARQTRCSSPPESSTVRRVREVRRADLAERDRDPRPDLLGRDGRCSRDRTRPRSRRASSRPGSRGPGRPTRRCRRARPARASGCRGRRPRPARRSGRRGSAGRAPRARAAASTCRCRTARAARRPRPRGARARRRARPARRPGRRTRGRSTRARAIVATATRATARRERDVVDPRPGGTRRARRPRRPKPRASIASASPVARSSDPATSGESSIAYPRTPWSSTPRPRTDSANPAASRSRLGTRRVASATASAERRANPAAETSRSWSTRSVYALNARPTTASRSPLTTAIRISSVERSSGPITGSVGPSQSSVPPPDDQVSGEITMTPSALKSAPPM